MIRYSVLGTIDYVSCRVNLGILSVSDRQSLYKKGGNAMDGER